MREAVTTAAAHCLACRSRYFLMPLTSSPIRMSGLANRWCPTASRWRNHHAAFDAHLIGRAE
jgi:hypothetical protein